MVAVRDGNENQGTHRMRQLGDMAVSLSRRKQSAKTIEQSARVIKQYV